MLSAQPRLVRPAQLPLKTCSTASDKVPGVTVTVWLAEVAVKEYQTSSSAVPAQPACESVAPTVVPAVVAEQVPAGLTVRAVAPEQLLLPVEATPPVTHTVKLPCEPALP